MNPQEQSFEQARARAVVSRAVALYHLLRSTPDGFMSAPDAAQVCGDLAEAVFALGVADGWLVFVSRGPDPSKPHGFRIVEGQRPSSGDDAVEEAADLLGGLAERAGDLLRRAVRGAAGAVAIGTVGSFLGGFMFSRPRVAAAAVFAEEPAQAGRWSIAGGQCDCGAAIVRFLDRRGRQIAYLHVGSGHDGDDGEEDEEDPPEEGEPVRVRPPGAGTPMGEPPSEDDEDETPPEGPTPEPAVAIVAEA